MQYIPTPHPCDIPENDCSALDFSILDLPGTHNTAPICIPQKSPFFPRPHALTHHLPCLQTQGLVFQHDPKRPYVHFPGQDEAELAEFRRYVEMFSGTKADCLPETLWKDLTRGQGFWDMKGSERKGWLTEMRRKKWEIKQLGLALKWMDQVEEQERGRERKRAEKCGFGRKTLFSAPSEVFRSRVDLEEELEVTEVSRVSANANGESRSKIDCATHDSSDNSMVTAVGEEVGCMEIEGCGTATLLDSDRIQDWIEDVADVTAKPTVWIPHTPRSPPSPSVYSQNLVSDDSLEVAEVYDDGRRPHFVEKRPKVPESCTSGSSACSWNEKLPVSAHNVGDGVCDGGDHYSDSEIAMNLRMNILTPRSQVLNPSQQLSLP